MKPIGVCEAAVSTRPSPLGGTVWSRHRLSGKVPVPVGMSASLSHRPHRRPGSQGRSSRSLFVIRMALPVAQPSAQGDVRPHILFL